MKGVRQSRRQPWAPTQDCGLNKGGERVLPIARRAKKGEKRKLKDGQKRRIGKEGRLLSV
jgi:hypothetical protein